MGNNQTIILDEDYFIEKDRYSWVLNWTQEKVKSNGISYTSINRFYYATLTQLLKDYVDQKCKECGSVNELMEVLNKLNEKIDSLEFTIKR